VGNNQSLLMFPFPFPEPEPMLKRRMTGKCRMMEFYGVDGDFNGRGFSLCAAPSLVESGVREFR
jgi:hypothetical protein